MLLSDTMHAKIASRVGPVAFFGVRSIELQPERMCCMITHRCRLHLISHWEWHMSGKWPTPSSPNPSASRCWDVAPECVEGLLTGMQCQSHTFCGVKATTPPSCERQHRGKTHTYIYLTLVRATTGFLTQLLSIRSQLSSTYHHQQPKKTS